MVFEHMERVKSTFSIKNLENLSGIKAHTLRIWEKRYNLLEPERTDTNIRRYSLDSLRKLLNVTLLYNHGFKISKIASLDASEIPKLVRSIALKANSEQVSINAFKLAMINFDYELFDTNYEEILQHHNFEYLFMNIFMPLMKELGILWQTGAISPSHEHFITNLVKQKIHLQTEYLQKNKYEPNNHPILFCFFLRTKSTNSVFFISITYHYQRDIVLFFLDNLYKPPSLQTLYSYETKYYFVSYITVEPSKDEIMPYLQNFYDKILDKQDSKLILFGPQQIAIDKETLPEKIEMFRSVESFVFKYFSEDVLV